MASLHYVASTCKSNSFNSEGRSSYVMGCIGLGIRTMRWNGGLFNGQRRILDNRHFVREFIVMASIEMEQYINERVACAQSRRVDK